MQKKGFYKMKNSQAMIEVVTSDKRPVYYLRNHSTYELIKKIANYSG